jgi:hypothetical protein
LTTLPPGDGLGRRRPGLARLTGIAAATMLFAGEVPSAGAAGAGGSSEEKDACFHAVDSGQQLRTSRKLAAAKDQFIVCARPVCPGPVKKDCAQWLAEVEATLPSVVFGAKDPKGGDLLDVSVAVDNSPLLDKLDGSSIPIDPGPHVFHFEWKGHTTVDQQVLIREGEKNRLVTATFPMSSAPGVLATTPTPQATGSRPIPVGVWILGGLAVAGGAAFTGLGLAAESEANNLRSTCAPNCSSSQVDSARVKVILADVSLGVGIASLGIATTWLLLSRSSKGETTTVSVEPTLGGGRASLAVSF